MRLSLKNYTFKLCASDGGPIREQPQMNEGATLTRVQPEPSVEDSNRQDDCCSVECCLYV